MYPAGETYTTLMSVAFLNSLQDANMLVANTTGSTALFPSDRIKIVLGNDAAVVGSKDTISLPLNLPTSYIAIGRPYGTEHGYCGADINLNVRCYLPFSVYTMTAATIPVSRRAGGASAISVFLVNGPRAKQHP